MIEQCSGCGLARYLAIEDDRCNCGQVFPVPGGACDHLWRLALKRTEIAACKTTRKSPSRWRATWEGMIHGAVGVGDTPTTPTR